MTTKPLTVPGKPALAGLCLLAAILIGALIWVYFGYRHFVEVSQDFSTLWGTHDLVRAHILAHDELPGSWDELEPLFKDSDRGYGNGSLSYLQERIILNLDAGEAIPWVVKVRSGNIEREEHQANQQLLALLRAPANDP
jgi:hypothetical protein